MKHPFREEQGFALLAVLFAVVILSTLAVGALSVSDNERRASRAVRAGGVSFYAGEAGLHEIWATRLDSAFADSLDHGLIDLPPGGSIDLGWHQFPNGARYSGRLWRYDNGGQRIYGLVAEGQGARGLRGQHRVSFGMTELFGKGKGRLGKCCDAAATVRGDATMNKSNGKAKHEGHVTGRDGVPAGPGWTEARCKDVPREDKTGILIQDKQKFGIEPPAILDGVPAIDQDELMDDEQFKTFGDITFDDLKAMADHVIEGKHKGNPNKPERKLHLKSATKFAGTTETCDTSIDTNWGSDDPNDPCYDYFPIIVIKGEVEVKSGYGQALVIMDLIEGIGSEFELEGGAGSVFAGLIIGFGCPEIENHHQMYGAVYADKIYYSQTCSGDAALAMREKGSLQWSSCVVDKVLERTGVGTFPVVGFRKLSRGFGTMGS